MYSSSRRIFIFVIFFFLDFLPVSTHTKCVLNFDENVHLSLSEEVGCCLVFWVGNFCNISRDLVIIYSLLPMKIAFVNNIFVNTYMNNIIFIFCCHCATALDKLYVIADHYNIVYTNSTTCHL